MKNPFTNGYVENIPGIFDSNALVIPSLNVAHD
jgi:hypothetical protein